MAKSQILSQMETASDALLYELKVIWDEVGESEEERDKMLIDLERECLEVYRRKVDQANRARAQLRQAFADLETELATICSTLGEPSVHLRQYNNNVGSLKEEIREISMQIEEMRERRNKRRTEFVNIIGQIHSIASEIGPSMRHASMLDFDDTDLSVRRFDDLQKQLLLLQTEKANRLKQIADLLGTLSSLCLVLGIDFNQTATEIHPSLEGSLDGSEDISDGTIEALTCQIRRLRDVKLQRMQKLQDLATSMLELWSLMDTPMEEQQEFQKVTCNIAASEDEITEPSGLSLDFIDYVETEVRRLEALKSSKMKDLVLRKKAELSELCRRTHLIAGGVDGPEAELERIEAGVIDPAFVLGHIEVQISTVKEEAFSRREILERVEKWLSACEEEAWLEEYNRDDNRYNGRGVHLALRRAEKARNTVNKIPGLVEALVAKITAWEEEREADFMYDGVRLLSMMEEYTMLRQEKEQERKRLRDERRLHGQLLAEQEVLYGSKPSPLKPQNTKKVSKTPNGATNKRVSANFLLSKPDSLAPVSTGRKGQDTMQTPRKPFVPPSQESSIPSTPSKPISISTEDNISPTRMKLATTPAPVSRISDVTISEQEDNVAEYSFEERRAGFFAISKQARCVHT